MKVLITGATGLVGRAITDLLLSQGHSVHYLTTSRKKIFSKENYKGYYWNPETGEIDLESFDKVTAIINLAGATVSKRWTTTYKKEIADSRIKSIKTLHKALQGLKSVNIETFVSASAIGIYPNSQDSLYHETETKTDSSFLGEVVKEWENELNTLNKFGFAVAKIRIGLVLSSEGGALPKMAKPIRNYVGAAFGTGEQWQSWIHIEDLARMFLYLLENKLGGIFNGVAPNPVTNAKLTREIATTLNRPLIFPNVPKIMMNLALGEMSYILFASQRVSSKKIQDTGFEFYFSNIRGALDDLLSEEKPNRSESTSSLLNEYAS